MGISVFHKNLSLFWIFELYCTSGFMCSPALEDYCAELSPKSLSLILGQAYNPRYMSIEPPSSGGGGSGTKEDQSKMGSKRSSVEIPFYADDDVLSLGSFPAWETNHFTYFEKKDSLKTKTIHVRNIFEGSGPGPGHDVFKTRPWECSSIINWIDLGLNYFPRYIRSIECIAKKCWYGHFNCKPKSFTIKVLRRKPGSCIHVSDKLILITSDEFINDYTQLWIWEEIAVNFCCECVMLY